MEPNKNKNYTAAGRDDQERDMAWSKGLHARYDVVAQAQLPDRFRDLLEQLEDAESRKR